MTIVSNLDIVPGLSKGSHFELSVKCDFRVSNRCSSTMRKQYRTVLRDRNNNEGKDICFFCSRTRKYSGRQNPNAKYNIDDGFFEEIDSPEKAYLLGWIASDGHVRKSGFSISIHQQDIMCLKKLRDMVCKDTPISFHKKNMAGFSISSQNIAKDICRHLRVTFGKKSNSIRFPDCKFQIDFLRGVFDGDGSILKPSHTARYPKCDITSSSKDFLSDISAFIDIPHCVTHDKIMFSGNNALDFMSMLYDGASNYLSRKRDLYLDWSIWVPSLGGSGSHGNFGKFQWRKTRKDAVPPFKTRASDSGYDLTILEKVKEFGKVELWDTGIKVLPEYGWYFDLVPRSSIIKSGYILANMIGVIDRTYTGNIMVALTKIDAEMPDLKGGERLVQIIPRPIVHVEPVEVDELDATERDSGRFGSTGK